MTGRANWREDAACLHADPDLFFPIASLGPALDQIDQAKQICAACPVREPCLAWALDLGVVSGIWGAPARPSGAPSAGPPPAIASMKWEGHRLFQADPCRDQNRTSRSRRRRGLAVLGQGQLRDRPGPHGRRRVHGQAATGDVTASPDHKKYAMPGHKIERESWCGRMERSGEWHAR